MFPKIVMAFVSYNADHLELWHLHENALFHKMSHKVGHDNCRSSVKLTIQKQYCSTGTINGAWEKRKYLP